MGGRGRDVGKEVLHLIRKRAEGTLFLNLVPLDQSGGKRAVDFRL